MGESRGCEGGAGSTRGIDSRTAPQAKRYFRTDNERNAIRISFILYLAGVAIGIVEVAASAFKTAP